MIVARFAVTTLAIFTYVRWFRRICRRRATATIKQPLTVIPHGQFRFRGPSALAITIAMIVWYGERTRDVREKRPTKAAPGTARFPLEARLPRGVFRFVSPFRRRARLAFADNLKPTL